MSGSDLVNKCGNLSKTVTRLNFYELISDESNDYRVKVVVVIPGDGVTRRNDARCSNLLIASHVEDANLLKLKLKNFEQVNLILQFEYYV